MTKAGYGLLDPSRRASHSRSPSHRVYLGLGLVAHGLSPIMMIRHVMILYAVMRGCFLRLFL
jgi:hypothetical protein